MADQELSLGGIYMGTSPLSQLKSYHVRLFTGGLIFGWNALALMLKAQGNYNRNCVQPISGL
jgi:hypothetical protein